MKKNQFKKIVFKDEDNNGYKRRFSFIGKWIIKNKNSESSTNRRYSLALSEKKKLVLFINGGIEKPYYETFDSFDNIIETCFVPEDILELIAESEKFIEELDI